MATSKYLIDVFLRHQSYLEGIKAGLIGSFDPTLRKIDRLIRDALTGSGVTTINELSNRELERLIRGIRATEEKLLGDYAQKLLDKFEAQAGYEADFAEQALRKALIGGPTIEPPPAGAAWALAKTQPIQAVGQLIAPFMTNWTQRDVLAVEAVLRNAHAQGWTMQQTILAIRGTKKNGYTDGVLSTIQKDIDLMVRTAIQHISNSARGAVWEANADILTGERWISTLDSRTTSTCRSLDQKVFPFGEGPRPPVHLGCRSVTVPEMPETADLLGGTLGRASKGAEGGAQVPANQTYYQWLRGQPASFQDTILGPTRGKLFRNGGLSAEEFARLNLGRNFEPLTLDEMRALAPEAFNAAGL